MEGRAGGREGVIVVMGDGVKGGKALKDGGGVIVAWKDGVRGREVLKDGRDGMKGRKGKCG